MPAAKSVLIADVRGKLRLGDDFRVTDARLLDENNRRSRARCWRRAAGWRANAAVLPAGEPRFCAGAPRRRRRPLAFPLADEGDHRAGETQALDPVSPRLQQLMQELAAGGSTACFWQEREQEGTPMVEPVDAGHQRVTFLWRGARKTSSCWDPRRAITIRCFGWPFRCLVSQLRGTGRYADAI